MRTKYAPNHARNYADSEYLSYVDCRVERKGAEFTGNKQTYSFTYTQLYILLQKFSDMKDIR